MVLQHRQKHHPTTARSRSDSLRLRVGCSLEEKVLSLRGAVWGGQDGSVLVFPSRRWAQSNLGFVEDREGRNDVIELVDSQTVVVVKMVGSGH